MHQSSEILSRLGYSQQPQATGSKTCREKAASLSNSISTFSSPNQVAQNNYHQLARPISQRRTTIRTLHNPLTSSICSNCFTTMTTLIATSCLLVLIMTHDHSHAASVNRVNMHQVSKQTNQYFLNEFCDLESKTLRSAKKLRQTNDTHSVFLTSRNTLSSVRVLPQKQQLPSSISFGFGSSANQPQVAPLVKQLNCSIIVVAPKSHGLLVTVNSIGLPANLTKLGITLNHDSLHAQQVHLEGQTTSTQYLLTQPQSSKIAINLQSFQPIDWSHVSFDILFTVYKKANSTGCPNKKWFDCGDNICVPNSLVCDRNRNCPNGNDEMIFYRCYSPLFWSIAASSALALILVVLMISVIIIVRHRRAGRLSKINSFSNNQLAIDGDLMQDGSRMDLTQADLNHRVGAEKSDGSYWASNLYLGGFENPVWNANGTLTKQGAGKSTGSGGVGAPAVSFNAPASETDLSRNKQSQDTNITEQH